MTVEKAVCTLIVAHCHNCDLRIPSPQCVTDSLSFPHLCGTVFNVVKAHFISFSFMDGPLGTLANTSHLAQDTLLEALWP